MNSERPSPGWRQLSLVPQAWRNSTQPDSRLAYRPISLVMKAHGAKTMWCLQTARSWGLVATMIPTPLIIRPPDELQ